MITNLVFILIYMCIYIYVEVVITISPISSCVGERER